MTDQLYGQSCHRYQFPDEPDRARKLSNVVSYSAFKAEKGRIDPAVADIIDALRSLGGAAHRQDVANCVARRRSGRYGHASKGESDEIFAAFEAYVSITARRRPAPLLHTPLGSGSYRWALTETCRALLDDAHARPVAGSRR